MIFVLFSITVSSMKKIAKFSILIFCLKLQILVKIGLISHRDNCIQLYETFFGIYKIIAKTKNLKIAKMFLKIILYKNCM